MAWALPVGAVGALLGWVIRWIGLSLRPVVHLNRVLVTAGLGFVIGLTAMVYQLISGNSFTPGAVLRPGGLARAGRARRRLLGRAC